MSYRAQWRKPYRQPAVWEIGTRQELHADITFAAYRAFAEPSPRLKAMSELEREAGR